MNIHKFKYTHINEFGRDHGCLPFPGINAEGVSESELEVTGNSDSEVTEYFLISLTFDPR